MRVHELAKEYGIKSTEFVDIIQDFGIDIKSHLSTIDDVQVATIRQELNDKEEEPLAKSIGAEEVERDAWTLSGDTVMEVAEGVSISSEEVQEALATNIKSSGEAREKYAETVKAIAEDPGNWSNLAKTEEVTNDNEDLSFGQKAFAKAEEDTTAKDIAEAPEVIVEKPSGIFGWLKGLIT